MAKIAEIFKSKDRTISFELFPPKSDDGYTKLKETIEDLAKLEPDFISCTYGAGGGTRDKTFDIVEYIEKSHQISAMAHLTCVLNTKDQIKELLEDLKSRKVENVLALRGDPPRDNPNWQPQADNFQYSSELCAFIREHFGKDFSIGVAGFPEGHVLCPDRDQDALYLKSKTDAGADFVITQLFYDNKDYFDYVKRLRNIGVTSRIIPGILPITNYTALLKFTALCGASVSDEVKSIFAPIEGDLEKTLQAGIEFASKQCQELLDHGAPGLHFYCLNKVSPTKEVLANLTL